MASARIRGDCVRETVALFPRYLFVRIDEGYQQVAPIRSTIGVSTLVRFGTSYAVVPDPVVSLLQTRADPISGLHVGRGPSIAPGCRVHIGDGPFEGLDAIFQCEIGHDRVLVLMEFLGQLVKVQVAMNSLVPSSEAA
jgi:transcriptional antiterminator RfaH